jgi:hypothetical protein
MFVLEANLIIFENIIDTLTWMMFELGLGCNVISSRLLLKEMYYDTVEV